ncbi:cupin domain-containing protein [Shewanella sp. VB17]|uniref:cupin domain-containing protein n=1 Tax=Shewanella sp. VB17 TaxID=2739432 RepID=UPI001565D03B|nr:cupin domain-containing protein [Shewanella sp. VB17]NRD74110.1 cupin domain-containing protein [Shewanella sp. VB17]
MIKNFLNNIVQVCEKSHDGVGPYDLHEIWSSDDFKSNIDFIDRVVIPPHSTVGYHKHGNNEEMYIVLEGNGQMTLNGEKVQITKGDMILNQPWGEHGLVNHSSDNIDLLVIQISL